MSESVFESIYETINLQEPFEVKRSKTLTGTIYPHRHGVDGLFKAVYLKTMSGENIEIINECENYKLEDMISCKVELFGDLELFEDGSKIIYVRFFRNID